MAFVNWLGGGANNGLAGTGISAAGTTQGTATTLFAQENEVTTVASGAGVIINPLFAPGEAMSVLNLGANALMVYPPSGMKINALPTNQGMQLGLNTAVMFRCISTTRIAGFLSA